MSEAPFEKHEIQLHAIRVLESSVKWLADPDYVMTEREREDHYNSFSLQVDPGVYDTVRGMLPVTIQFEVPNDQVADARYAIRAVFQGVISVPQVAFEKDGLERWARFNGFFMLVPFLREIVFSATLHLPCGPYFVPLLTMKDSAITDPEP